jgi:capsular exopolysaccharide synthesis family protein
MDPLKMSAPQETKLHFLDYWRIIRIRKTVILAVFLLVVITATLVTLIYPESFASTARIKIERDITDIPSLTTPQMMGGSYDPYFIQTEFEVIQSEVVLSKVIDALDLNEEWGKKYAGGQRLKTPETILMLKGHIYLRPVRNTELIEIQVRTEKPEEAARIANQIAETYREHRLAQRAELTKNGIKTLQEQFEEQEKKVNEAQENVDQLRNELQIPGDVVGGGGEGATPLMTAETLRHLESLRIEREAEFAKQDKLLSSLQAMSREELRKALPTAVTDPQLSSLMSELDLAEQNLIRLKRDYAPDHPIYQNAKENVEDLNRKINDRVEGILVGLRVQVDAMKADVNALKDEVDKAKALDIETAKKTAPYSMAKRHLEELEHFRQALNTKILSENIDQALPKNSMVEIVDRAQPNPHAVSPNKPLNIIAGIILGLVVGIGLAFFIEYLDTSVKTIDDVERTLQAPVLGVIPQNTGLILDEGGESPHAEAYRVLRTNLLFSRKDDKLNTVAVVSAGAGEGKSTTVFNLATAFAQNGDRVLIVDSDLRRPTLHKMLRVTNTLGLTNFLLKQNTMEEVIQTTNLPTLNFMASGKMPSSSLGVLSSAQMKDLISELKQRYDFIFFDSPPIMGVSDASILASEVDMTLQVIQYRRYPQPMNIRAKQMIEKVGGNLVGIVLNNINMSQDESYYYYSGYYHEYYSRHDEETTPAEGAGAATEDKPKLDIKPKY